MMPKDGTEVIVTFSENPDKDISKRYAIKALWGRGKGERLVERLLQSRREDLECDERNQRRLSS